MDTIVDVAPSSSGLAPFSLKDAPALIERVFPAQKVGIEAQKEKKSGSGQTLTALGAFWKGRKPLVLARACVLASLLPATDDPEADLELFEMLMRMDQDGLTKRSPKITAAQVWSSDAISWPEKVAHLVGGPTARPDTTTQSEEITAAEVAVRWKPLGQGKGERSRASHEHGRQLVEAERHEMRMRAFAAMPFSEQVSVCERLERAERLSDPNDAVYAGIWPKVNARLGTSASSIRELCNELGLARFGRRPIVGDPFCGGGSIPYEAARIGCDVVASDLNPVATMLTWGALNVLGAEEAQQKKIIAEHQRILDTIETSIEQLGIERNTKRDRAKAYIYCLEVLDPQTGWRVPMAPSWVISRNHRCVAKLKANYATRTFDIEIETGVPSTCVAEAEVGTVRDGALVYHLALQPGGPVEEWRVPISRLRGDADLDMKGSRRRTNRLRSWDATDVLPRPHLWAQPDLSVDGHWIEGDVWQERLYCIQWIDKSDIEIGKARPRTYYAAPDSHDLAVEARIAMLVRDRLPTWQADGLAPEMALEWGREVEGLMRTMGWTYWHHLFTPRSLLVMSEVMRHRSDTFCFVIASYLDYVSRLGRWDAGHPGSSPQVKNAFASQALRTNFSYACKSSYDLRGFLFTAGDNLSVSPHCRAQIGPHNAAQDTPPSDLFIFDPPYADAVYYHEITEFFIAWLKKDPPAPFRSWTWDSRRPLAIQGKGEQFRSDMVKAFRTMAARMPDHGLQVCMFTHQDAGVWADMAGIVWGAGLRVTAAWYVSTETTSELKKGGYVQGTVLLVLRKRQGDERAYKDELVLEVRGAVQRQVDLLTGLNQKAKARQRDENPFSDADVQMAGYAAALEVLTGYTHIEGVDMTREALRPRVKGEVGIVEEMIALAVQTATELMRPDGIDERLWERLVPTERFWLKMTEAEANRPAGQPQGKLDDYQNFAKAYRADGWDDLMADTTPNKARLKGASEFKRSLMTGHPFAGGLVRPVLYAVSELRMAAEKEDDHNASGERAISGLRDNLTSWAQQRQQAMVVADWMGRMLNRQRPAEASAARTLAALIRNERLG